MIDIVFSPRWFYGTDLIFDAVSVIVLFLISYFSLKYYQLNKSNKNYLYLALAFLTIAVSFIVKIVINFKIYFTAVEQATTNIVAFTQLRLWSSHALYTFGTLASRALLLFGLYLVYRLSEKKGTKWTEHALMLFLIGVIVYFTQDLYYVFHAIALVLLILISYNYIRLYFKNKNINTKLLSISFMLMAVSQLIFVFIRLDFRLYVIAEAIQLAAFIILLITFIMVLYNGKKKE